jgi:uncharacterized repeat protein (TIGR03943 family)
VFSRDLWLKFSSIIFCALILVLAATGKLVLFVSSQYVLFAVITAVVGLVVLVSQLFMKSAHSHSSDHGHDHDSAPDSKPKLLTVGFTVLAAVLMLVLAPTSLSNSFSSGKPVNGGSLAGEVKPEQWEDFTVKEWAAVTGSGTDFSFNNKTVTLEGYVTYVNDDTFYLTRLVVHCCAIDSQPAGLRVHLEDWQDKYNDGEWLRVTGGFQDVNNTSEFSLVPESVEQIKEPENPYVS